MQAKKANEAAKTKEKAEADKWKSGAKGASKADLEAAKKAELAAKKAERERLLAEEEANAPVKKKAPTAKDKKAAAEAKLKAQTASIAAVFRTDDPAGLRRDEDRKVDELSATGIEGMLEALEVVNAKTSDQAMGAKAGEIERHPEKRYKAAFAAYLEREMPKLKEDHPGLRQNQMREIIHKQFQKAPENPFNQVSVAYNASKDDRLDTLKKTMKAREDKYRVESE
ncbi:DUF1014-domain-containing protein [Cutaneotrichosporon oleaginosum]|uniref:DUF1014-domain-containing protein n=1 Tax=Cutaneotrichosporon oleaginosum TaxID=879819 RepID=A0A0J0XTE1_9TREE|nr:DUF1014-domain-containing protein [Cutaneotrichosporon oleaginosum]KLT44351.1 DUF1014-domain-containing protein [Cutaneotrichosporon oleaginosum]TXT07923.1 hypothetical protein COLE_04847 [Cutaneotrichosporon oleaginosum]